MTKKELSQSDKRWMAVDDAQFIIELAHRAVEEVMIEGVVKHDPRDWKKEDEEFHINRCIRHLQSYLLQKHGHEKPDGENHLELALCRMVMAHYINKQN